MVKQNALIMMAAMLFVSAHAVASGAVDCSEAASNKAEQEGVEYYLPDTQSSGELHRPMMRVIGNGRLQFYSSPNLSCKMPGVFIIPGDSVTAYTEYGDFVSVMYVTRSGDTVEGWVLVNRLKTLK